jgi:hypothetical protein
LTTIPREAARLSVNNSAQAKGGTRDEMLVKFVENKLEQSDDKEWGIDKFLAAHAPEHLRGPLRMVFTFYCDPRTRTGLQHRVNLP